MVGEGDVPHSSKSSGRVLRKPDYRPKGLGVSSVGPENQKSGPTTNVSSRAKHFLISPVYKFENTWNIVYFMKLFFSFLFNINDKKINV